MIIRTSCSDIYKVGAERTNIIMDSIPEVVSQKILRYLEHTDVLILRLFDRSWRRRCTEYLRANKNILVVRFPHCARIGDINAMLEKSDDIPFTGISFSALKPGREDYCTGHCSLLLGEDVESLYPFLFQNMVVDYFHIEYTTRQNCVADKVLRKMLLSCGDSIKHLWIQELPTCVTSIIDYLGIQADSSHLSNLFSSLETLKFSPSHILYPQKWEKKFIYEVLNVSPNIRSCEATLKLRTLLKGKYDTRDRDIRLFKTLYIEYMDPNVEVLSTLKVRNIRVLILSPPNAKFPESINHNHGHFKTLSEYVGLIAERCHTSLFSIHNYFFMNLLMSVSLGGMSFVNLRQLTLVVIMNKYAGVHWQCLQSINYGHFCPHLTHVQFLTIPCQLTYQDSPIGDPENIEDFSMVGKIHNYQKLALELNNVPKYKCYSVRYLQLQLERRFPNDSKVLEFVSKLFPNVRDLDCLQFSARYLVDHVDTLPWKTSLTCITCNFTPYDFISVILDFCVGIGIEELATLKNIVVDADSLRNWSFAPKRKSFENTAIRKFKIKLSCHENCNPNANYYKFPHMEHIDIIGRWIRTKLPGFEVEVHYNDRCDENCNPVRLDLWKKNATLSRKFRRGSPICTLRFDS